MRLLLRLKLLMSFTRCRRSLHLPSEILQNLLKTHRSPPLNLLTVDAIFTTRPLQTKWVAVNKSNSQKLLPFLKSLVSKFQVNIIIIVLHFKAMATLRIFRRMFLKKHIFPCSDSKNFSQMYYCLVVSLICLSFINYNLLYCCFINYKIINYCLA